MKSLAPGLISVIIPTRNRPELLRRAIASVVAQDYRPIELIIIDNLSDSAVEVDPGDLECVVHRNSAMLNLPTNRNLGVSMSSGEFVSFLDDDDWYTPNKLSLLAGKMDGIDMCYGNTSMVGRHGTPLGVCRGGTEIDQLMLYRYIHNNAVLVRRSMFDEVLFDENMTTFEDVDFMFRVVRQYAVRHVDEIVAVWNRDDRPDQMTARNLPRAFRNWLRLCKRFAPEIDRYPMVGRFYYRKMFLLAMTQLRPVVAIQYFLKYVSARLKPG